MAEIRGRVPVVGVLPRLKGAVVWASAAQRASDAVAVILDRLLVMVDWLAESDRRDMDAVKRVLAASTAKGEAINAHSSEERGG